MRHISGEQRQTERDRLRNDRNLFPQSESRKAPQAGLSGILGQLVLPCIPTSSPRLVTQLLLNLKSEEEGWRRVLFHSCPCFFPSPSSPRLSLQHETGPQPQTDFPALKRIPAGFLDASG
ncbi:hypothetical protein ILYODFUR_010017 [Ilyodon furcidens]|uniref:Uncharacterized protein n=1 Tax=Ilyodon furcidens TaxID=33524 RepID=A0ABV0TIT3_9TELE